MKTLNVTESQYIIMQYEMLALEAEQVFNTARELIKNSTRERKKLMDQLNEKL